MKLFTTKYENGDKFDRILMDEHLSTTTTLGISCIAKKHYELERKGK